MPSGIDNPMELKLTPESALKEAVDCLGSQGRFARLCGVRQPSVWKWLNKGKSLPAQHVLAVEAATGISRHDLRPDIYPFDSSGPLTQGIASTDEPARAPARNFQPSAPDCKKPSAPDIQTPSAPDCKTPSAQASSRDQAA